MQARLQLNIMLVVGVEYHYNGLKMNILQDLNIPGYKVLRWAMVVLVIAPLLISLLFSDSNALSLLLRIMVLLFDAICIYIIYWILRRGMLNKYYNIIIAISVLALGETLIAFV